MRPASAAIAERRGIRTVDAWDVLADAVRGEGGSRYYLEGDIHFTPEGHRLVADWLDEELFADEARARP